MNMSILRVLKEEEFHSVHDSRDIRCTYDGECEDYCLLRCDAVYKGTDVSEETPFSFFRVEN
jgi:hypothetical protein